MTTLIHRFGLSGGAQCGAGRDELGRLRINNSGILVTCPECVAPSREESRKLQLAAIQNYLRINRKP